METKMFQAIIATSPCGQIRPVVAASMKAEAWTLFLRQYPQPKYLIIAVNEIK